MAEHKELRFGISIPQIFPDGVIDPAAIARWLVKAESLGYYGAWTQEQVLGAVAALDPVPLLSYAAALTSCIKLGTSVLLTALRNPVPLAKSLATLDQLSQGRLMVGMGLGGYADIYPAFGMTREGRARRFEEGVQLMKKLWTQDKVTFRGRFTQLDNQSIDPRPLQNPHPPIWIGAVSPGALKRAVRLGDGWMGAGASSTSNFTEEIKLIRQYLEEEGRDPDTFTLSKRVYVAVDRDKKRADQKLREWFGRYSGDPEKIRVAVFGSEDECIDELAKVVAEGIEMLMVNPLYDFEEQAERLAKDVLPKLG
ncbi:MAG: LLM class flavin-dependent oxidoreductase [Dehalococcoidia bacterium]|nr:LLM class flavin-dependent oxidoreductase [Dehalococcoidia bacterium]MDP7202297.1 LLM class flavin-dependent oxidoreductase [Dehalococcoidia bacterium]